MADPATATEQQEAILSVAKPVDLTELLGTAIKKKRFSLGISQEQLAVRAGLHRTYVSDVERGARNPSIRTIGKIAHALQVPLFELFHECDDPHQHLTD